MRAICGFTFFRLSVPLLVSDIDYATVKAFLISKREATYSSGRFRNLEKKRKYAAKAEDKSYSRDTIRIMVMTLRALLNEAVREKLLQDNPVKDLAAFYRKRAKDKVVTRNDVYTLEELYSVEDQLRNRTLYGDDYEMSLTMSRTGMRIGEARGLQWDDFNWQEKRIRICRNIPSGTGVEEDSAKTPAGERWVEMSEELCNALKALQARRRIEGMKTGRRGHGNVFKIRYEEFYQDWTRAQAQAGVRYRSPHSIRHTYASQMLMAGVNPVWLAKQMGHSSPNVTLTIYAHFVQDGKAQTVNAMDRGKTNANEMQIAQNNNE
jgi:integrase